MEQDLADIKADLADMKNDISEIVALIECLRLYQPSLLSYINVTLMDYFPILELPEEIQALVVERVAGNSFQDLYGLRTSCKLIKALADRRSVCHFYDVLSVPCGLNMPAELLKTCYAERNPNTLYMKGVQFFFTFNLQEEGLAFMKLAADKGYERAVHTYAMTRKVFGVMRNILLVLQGNQLIGSGN
ncbi:unnamed protein product [Brassica oleracea]